MDLYTYILIISVDCEDKFCWSNISNVRVTPGNYYLWYTKFSGTIFTSYIMLCFDMYYQLPMLRPLLRYIWRNKFSNELTRHQIKWLVNQCYKIVEISAPLTELEISNTCITSILDKYLLTIQFSIKVCIQYMAHIWTLHCPRGHFCEVTMLWPLSFHGIRADLSRTTINALETQIHGDHELKIDRYICLDFNSMRFVAYFC